MLILANLGKIRNCGVYSDSLLCWVGWAYFKNSLYHKIFHAKDCFVHLKWYNPQKGLALSNNFGYTIHSISFPKLVIGKSRSI